MGMLLSKYNILHITGNLHFKVMSYITVLMSMQSNVLLITLLFSYLQQNVVCNMLRDITVVINY